MCVAHPPPTYTAYTKLLWSPRPQLLVRLPCECGANAMVLERADFSLSHFMTEKGVNYTLPPSTITPFSLYPLNFKKYQLTP